MRYINFFVFLPGLIFFTTLVFISHQINFPLIPPMRPTLSKTFYDYSGITHVHSSLSTGSGDIPTIVEAAKTTNTQFVIITDLNPTSAKGFKEGYNENVLLMTGAEYGFSGGHLLSYGVNKERLDQGLGQNQILLSEQLSKPPSPNDPTFLIASHPFLDHSKWPDLNQPGLTGMEIINMESVWREGLKTNKVGILWSILILPFNPDLSYLRLYEEPRKEIEAWDQVLSKKPFVGMGGADATANAIPIPDKSLDFPSYQQAFRLMKNHVLLKSELTGSFQQDKKKILSALRQGSFYFSLDIIGDPAGFYFVASQNGQDHIMSGKTLDRKNGPITLTANIGRNIETPHEILLFHNGKEITNSNTEELKYQVKRPGVYRTTVRVIPTLPVPDGKKWFTWIYSNAIRIE